MDMSVTFVNENGAPNQIKKVCSRNTINLQQASYSSYATRITKNKNSCYEDEAKTLLRLIPSPTNLQAIELQRWILYHRCLTINLFQRLHIHEIGSKHNYFIEFNLYTMSV